MSPPSDKSHGRSSIVARSGSGLSSQQKRSAMVEKNIRESCGLDIDKFSRLMGTIRP
jgi:hypothetical protein